MNDLLPRFQRLKLVLTSLVLTLVGIGLIAIGSTTTEAQPSGWASFVPWNELGGIIVGAGLLSIWIDYLFRREHEAMADRRLRQILHDHAPAMRDAVLQAFAADRNDLVRVATPDTLDRIISNSLALRLGDEQFAREVFTDIRDQAVNAPERWHDMTLDVDLSPLPDHPEYFAVTIRREYTTIPAFARRTFACTSDKQEYAEMALPHSETSTWYLRSSDDFDASQREAYELLQVSVNGQERKIRRSARKHFQSYSVDLGAEVLSAGEPVTIAYTFRTVTRATGNLLFFDIEQPTRDASITLDYTGCGIEHISAIDHIPSVRPTRIEHSPADVPTRNIRVEIDGWVFPRAGVAFVWTVDHQAGPSAGRLVEDQQAER